MLIWTRRQHYVVLGTATQYVILVLSLGSVFISTLTYRWALSLDPDTPEYGETKREYPVTAIGAEFESIWNVCPVSS